MRTGQKIYTIFLSSLVLLVTVFSVSAKQNLPDVLKELHKNLLNYAQDERDAGDTSFARELESQARVVQSYVEKFNRPLDGQEMTTEVAAAKEYLDALARKINDTTGLRKATDQLYSLRPHEVRSLKMFMKIDGIRRDL